ncbi:alcohol dehydrogenase catalytic domain-containing protein [Actinokineospora diospyrosa]|uniref:alcohol dehydrogenase catalytic domain-containing protein n=1 Tax=Actinokineospora diospyrosa TaxID=103728 RepID=UPI0035565749
MLDSDNHADSRAALSAAVASGEPQLVVREGVAYVPRLMPAASTATLVPPSDIEPWRLTTSAPGAFDSLALVPAPESAMPLGPGQIRVAVRAAGVNFRDLAVALGLVPTDSQWPFIGLEGTGIVVGSQFTPGDRVTGMIDSGAFGPLPSWTSGCWRRCPLGGPSSRPPRFRVPSSRPISVSSTSPTCAPASPC